ncbi:DMT family transporter [Photobacterium profundum]|uniref:DMT family transporter n=1 Tax=Photobacterium profundum TaxID=74109 RepID=UPI003D100652
MSNNSLLSRNASEETETEFESLSLKSTRILYILGVGISVAVNFALAKYSVMNGFSPLEVLVLPLLGSAIILLALLALKGELKALKVQHLRYYIFAGLLGVSLPNLASNFALQEVAASTFSVLITLSPLFTLLLSIPFQKAGLTFKRVMGIGIGFVAVLLVTISPDFKLKDDGGMLLLATSVPLFLAMGNIYRSKSYPVGANPIALATGVLCIQVLIWLPISLMVGGSSIYDAPQSSRLILMLMAIISAFSYLLTFRLQQLTDGLGFSQVGNVVTVTGVGIGIFFFAEAFHYRLIVALALLFIGLAMTNQQSKQVSKSNITL